VVESSPKPGTTERWIRDYIDELGASLARCRKRNDSECSVCVERGKIADDIRRLLPEPNTITERWVASTPDEISHHSGDGHRYAIWGQFILPAGAEREPIPYIFSSGFSGGEVEFGAGDTWRLSLDEAEAFIARLQNAIAYERSQVGESR
jgi:hypothetical protein